MAQDDSIAVVLLAAGSGQRLGRGIPKALVPLGDLSILQHAALGVAAWSKAATIVVVQPEACQTEVKEQISALSLTNPLVFVDGGSSRTESVRNGLNAVATARWVLVHDAARALTPPEVYARVVAALAAGADAVLPVLPVVDTIKRASGDEIIASLDRSELVAAQTPQGFAAEALLDAYRRIPGDFTDDTAQMAAAGYRVQSCAGAEDSFKITTPADLRAAENLLQEKGARMLPEYRIGQGSDIHAFSDSGGELKLLGLSWPGETPLSGHSDGDAAIHAIVDALLSAAGLGDIGTIFGSDRPEFAHADSRVFLAETLRLIHADSWQIENVSVQVIANRPKISPKRGQAEALLQALLQTKNVSVAATTSDGLGFTGRGEGVEARAIALLSRSALAAE